MLLNVHTLFQANANTQHTRVPSNWKWQEFEHSRETKNPNRDNPQNNQQIALKQKKLTVLYAGLPDKDGKFKSVDVKNMPSENSFYKITILDNTQKEAKFEFYNSNNSTEDAIDSSDLFLRPVCEIDLKTETPTKIVTNISGTDNKIDNHWVLNTKAKITLC